MLNQDDFANLLEDRYKHSGSYTLTAGTYVNFYDAVISAGKFINIIPPNSDDFQANDYILHTQSPI